MEESRFSDYEGNIDKIVSDSDISYLEQNDSVSPIIPEYISNFKDSVEHDGEHKEKVPHESHNKPLHKHHNKLNQTNKNSHKKTHKLVSWQDTVKEKTISSLKNPWNLAFLVVLFFALLIRLKYIGQESLWNDAAVHLWYVVKVVKEPLFLFSSKYLLGDYVTVQTLTAFFYIFTKNIMVAGKIVAILFGLSGVIFMYLLGSELNNKFTGLISAALLGFHHLFWFYGVRLLADGPLVTMVVIVLYCIVKLEKENTLKWSFLSTIAFFGLILTKAQGILFFIAFLVYIIVIKRKEAIKNKAILLSWLIPSSLIFFGDLIFGGHQISQLYNMLFVDVQGLRDIGLNATKHFIWIFSWKLLIFMILGSLLILFYKKKKYYFSLFCFIFYWVAFEVGIRTPEDRYILPLLPIGIIITTFALTELSHYLILIIGKRKWSDYLKKGLVIIFVAFVCWQFYNVGNPLIFNKSYSYSGHAEAGLWMKENIPENVPIFAGSYRFVRLFTEREYGGPPPEDYGGTIWNMRAEAQYDINKSAFEEDLANLAKKSDVYLEIDRIEYTQPEWYYDRNQGGITQESIDYFNNLGFELIKVFDTKVLTSNGLQNIPAIFIFKKEQEIKIT